MMENENVERLKGIIPAESSGSVESALGYLIERGIISSRVMRELEIYRKYQTEVRQRGCPGRSTVAVAHREKISSRTLYRIREKLG